MNPQIDIQKIMIRELEYEKVDWVGDLRINKLIDIMSVGQANIQKNIELEKN